MTVLDAPATRFTLPPGRIATEPIERRGLARDEVALLVARPGGRTHSRFRHLPAHLRAGDLLVVNTSATIPAALDGTWSRGAVVVHLSSRRDDDTWVVELRHPDGSGPVLDAEAGMAVDLPGGATLHLHEPDGGAVAVATGTGVRLWRAHLRIGGNRTGWLRSHGRPITYGHVDRWSGSARGASPALRRTGDAPGGDPTEHRGPRASGRREVRFPLEDYQTVFARHPGSAEMPSAGRPFTTRLVTDLVSHGITLAPITLHTGVSSLEAHEPPRPERFHVPESTAHQVEQTRRRGGRVIAVGTTVTRALETVADRRGHVSAGQGWTELVLGPDRPARVVDGLVTGWHEPEASHLLLLEAVAGPDLVADAYAGALQGPYQWHEFGDSCLLLP